MFMSDIISSDHHTNQQQKDLKEKTLFILCQEHNASAQKALYDLTSTKLMNVSMRYLGDEFDAEEALINGYYKIFKSIEKVEWRGESAFNGWMKRVIVNECLMIIRKRKIQPSTTELDTVSHTASVAAEDTFQQKEIHNLIAKLPPGYRTVFNLYVVEGYTHKEIADQLGIQESTSKSQLNKARNQLKEWIGQLYGEIN